MSQNVLIVEFSREKDLETVNICTVGKSTYDDSNKLKLQTISSLNEKHISKKKVAVLTVFIIHEYLLSC